MKWERPGWKKPLDFGKEGGVIAEGKKKLRTDGGGKGRDSKRKLPVPKERPVTNRPSLWQGNWGKTGVGGGETENKGGT